MSASSSIVLVGVGGAGCAMARGARRAFGDGMRCVLADTDAASGQGDGEFLLLGGDRLSGRGSGGDAVTARLAAEDSAAMFDKPLSGARLAVVVAALGGGTGSGATLEAVKHISALGVPVAVFATTPFSFEGEERKRVARGMRTLVEEAADVAFFVPMDALADGEDNMPDAMRRAVDTLASAISLFWRVVERPGYIQLGVERLRRVVMSGGRGRFATTMAQGPTRAADAVDALARSPLLAGGRSPVGTILCGVLAGDDLRLSEVAAVAKGVRGAFGEDCAFELATVNDESTFAGRLGVALMLLEGSASEEKGDGRGKGAKAQRRKRVSVLGSGPTGRGRFTNAEPTIWRGEDLDIPTFIRRGMTNLDFR